MKSNRRFTGLRVESEIRGGLVLSPELIPEILVENEAVAAGLRLSAERQASGVNREILREYDIRGIAGRDLTDDVVLELGKSIGTLLLSKGIRRVVLGRDVRLSSQRIRDALAPGLLSTGLEVTDIGECPTPMLYYAIQYLNKEGGAMITGSHNPPEYNGIKVAAGTGTIYGEEIQKIGNILTSGSFAAGEGRLISERVHDAYVRMLAEAFPRLASPVRVVVDCGNGTAGMVAERVYRGMGCEVIPLYSEIDGRFPNHHPDPTVAENLEDLIRVVLESSADLGVAFDGDSDRIGVVDESGKIIWGDQLMILFARSILEHRPGSSFVAEVKCSKNLFDDIRRRGGKVIMWKAGHSLIKAKMREVDAVLGGEMSGHLCFADRYFGFDDAIYAGARLLEILSGSRRKLSEMLSDLPRTLSTPELRVDCPERYKFEVVRRLQRYFSGRQETVTVDGVRVNFRDGWGLVRASNTQPMLVLRFEADSEERLEGIRDMIEGKLAEVLSAVSSGA